MEKDDAATTKTAVYASLTIPTGTLCSLVTAKNGSSAYAYLNGTAASENPVDVSVSTQTLTTSTIRAQANTYREIALFNRALSDTERKAVENGMRTRQGISAV